MRGFCRLQGPVCARRARALSSAPSRSSTRTADGGSPRCRHAARPFQSVEHATHRRTIPNAMSLYRFSPTAIIRTADALRIIALR